MSWKTKPVIFIAFDCSVILIEIQRIFAASHKMHDKQVKKSFLNYPIPNFEYP